MNKGELDTAAGTINEVLRTPSVRLMDTASCSSCHTPSYLRLVSGPGYFKLLLVGTWYWNDSIARNPVIREACSSFVVSVNASVEDLTKAANDAFDRLSTLIADGDSDDLRRAGAAFVAEGGTVPIPERA